MTTVITQGDVERIAAEFEQATTDAQAAASAFAEIVLRKASAEAVDPMAATRAFHEWARARTRLTRAITEVSGLHGAAVDEGVAA